MRRVRSWKYLVSIVNPENKVKGHIFSQTISKYSMYIMHSEIERLRNFSPFTLFRARSFIIDLIPLCPRHVARAS